ncbi:MAG: 7TM diverse intracellular signaling domain-containing protein [Acidobacteriota bacterium]
MITDPKQKQHHSACFVYKKTFARLLAIMCLLVGAIGYWPVSSAWAEPVLHLDPSSTGYKLGRYTEYLEDPTGKLSIDDVTSSAYVNRFIRNQSDTPNFGLSHSTYWLRFKLDRSPSQATNWNLLYRDMWIQSAQIYIPSSAEPPVPWRVIDLSRERQRMPEESPLWKKMPLDGDAGKSVTYYVHMKSDGPLIMSLTINNEESTAHIIENRLLHLGIYYGIIIAMLCYNLFLFFALRDRSQIYYVFYVLCIGLYFFGVNKLSWYVWPGSSGDFLTRQCLFFLGFFISFAGMFARSFLTITRETPIKNGVVIACITAGLVLALAAPFGDLLALNQCATVLGFIIPTAYLAIGFIRWRRGYLPARYFVLAFAFVLLGGLVYALTFGGYLPFSEWTMGGMQVGSGLEVIFLSLALADRINVLREEKERALNRAEAFNNQLQEYGHLLEGKVEERTLELLSSNEKLREIDRLKTEFVANVAHEIRTPMTSILGFAVLAGKLLGDSIIPRADIDDPRLAADLRKSHQYMNIITSEGQRLADLVNDMLDLSKIEAGLMEWRMGPVYIEEIIDRAAASTASLFEYKELSLIRDIADDLPSIIGDHNRLVQVVINLISNAVKFTPRGTVTCRARLTNEGMEVSVIDTGLGISIKDQDMIFEKFKQASGDTLSDRPAGTGLGLPICKEIIEHHAGRIWVESEPGQGSIFSFVLPVRK